MLPDVSSQFFHPSVKNVGLGNTLFWIFHAELGQSRTNLDRKFLPRLDALKSRQNLNKERMTMDIDP